MKAKIVSLSLLALILCITGSELQNFFNKHFWIDHVSFDGFGFKVVHYDSMHIWGTIICVVLLFVFLFSGNSVPEESSDKDKQ